MIDVLAGQAHYMAHIWPVYASLPDRLRGEVLRPEYSVGRGPGEVALVAGFADVKRAVRLGYPRIVMMQHGAGQSYIGDRQSFPGGTGVGAVNLFLCPNEYSAARWRERYPDADVAIIGSPRVEHLRTLAMIHAEPVVAASFHWLCSLLPETLPAWREFGKAVLALEKDIPLIGHAHPRATKWLAPWWKTHGVPFVADFEEVCRNADVYICDNSSTIFEWAATGKPVVVLNSKRYRKSVHHGGRFWDWSTVGIQVDRPDDLAEAVRLALLDPPGIRKERNRIVREVYHMIDGSTAATVALLEGWV